MKLHTTVLSAALVTGLVFATATGPAQAAERDVAVTVYNRDLALIREDRSIDVTSGRSEVRFSDVAARLDPTSVHLVPARRGAFAVLEQNFQYDLASANRLLERTLGHELVVTGKDGEVTAGELVFFDNGGLVLKTDDGIKMIYRQELRDQIIPELPGGLVSRPTLSWLVDADRTGSPGAELSYLTGGMSWHAEYVAVVAPDDGSISLSSWVSVENHSGATYPEARLKLVAGDIHRVHDIRQMRDMAGRAMMAAEAEAQFEERGFFEFHLYDLERRTTIADRETKQISLFQPASISGVEKRFTFDAQRSGPKVVVTLEFDNSRSAGLGVPLPAGKVRVFKQDTDGSQEFIGEDRIDHTPRHEEVKLTVGRAFDVVAERKQTDHRRISSRVTENSFEIEVRNRKSEPITVQVVEHLHGDWEIIRSSHEYEKKAAWTVEFPLRVPADGTVKLTYTARIVS
jgi:hypothetical protein